MALNTTNSKFSNWARAVFWNAIPQIYRSEDAINGRLLEAQQSALAEVFDAFRDRIDNFSSLRSPTTISADTNLQEIHLTLGSVIKPKTESEQIGIRASINGSGEVTLPYSRVNSYDIGKTLVLKGSSIEANNGSFRISSIVNSTTVRTSPKLPTDSELSWSIDKAPSTDPSDVVVEVSSGAVSNIRTGWYIWDGSGHFDIKGKDRFAGSDTFSHLVDKEASDGIIANGTDSNPYLFSKKITFKLSDLGKPLVIPTAVVSDNAHQWQLGQVIDPSLIPGSLSGYSGIQLTGSTALVDSTQFYFAVMYRPRLTLNSTIAPLGVINKNGTDLKVTGGGTTVLSQSGALDSSDIGKVIRFWGASLYPVAQAVILTVSDPYTATIDTSSTVTAGYDLSWEIRKQSLVAKSEPADISDIGKIIEVDAYPPDLINLLAQDYGSSVAHSERVSRQRSWVRSLVDWMDRKGTAKAYEIIASLSGYSTVSERLFHVYPHSPVGRLIPINRMQEKQSTKLGKSGISGTLTLSGGVVTLTDPTANFSPTDYDSSVRISDTLYFTGGRYYISTVNNPTSVSFRPEDTPTGADAIFPDTCKWGIVSLYTKIEPRVPNFDELDYDLLSAFVGVANFHVDSLDMTSTPYNPTPYDASMAVMVVGADAQPDGTYNVTLMDTRKIVFSGVTGTLALVQTLTQAAARPADVYKVIDSSTVVVAAQPGSIPFDVGAAVASASPAFTGVVVSDSLGSAAVVVKETNWRITNTSVSSAEVSLESVPVQTVFTLPNRYTVTTSSVPIYDLALLITNLKYSTPMALGHGVNPTSTINVGFYSNLTPDQPDITNAKLLDRLNDAKPAHVDFISDTNFLIPIEGPSGPLGSPRLQGTTHIDCSPYGKLVYSDNYNIRTHDRFGNVITICGKANVNGNIDGAPGVGTISCLGLALRPDGTIVIAQEGDHTIRKIDKNGNLSTLAGHIGVSGSADGVGTLAYFNLPRSLTVDSFGNVYVGELNGQRIRKITPAGVVTTVISSAGGDIQSLDWSDDGFIYACRADHVVLKVNTATNTFVVFAGTPGVSGTIAGGCLNTPVGVCNIKGTDIILVSNLLSHTIASFTKTSGTLSLYAGSEGVPGTVGGDRLSARFNRPWGMRSDSSGNVFISDLSGALIRRINIKNGYVTTICGDSGFYGSNDF